MPLPIMMSPHASRCCAVVPFLVTFDMVTLAWENVLKMSLPVLMVNPDIFSSPGRRALNVVGVVCILGFTSSFTHLPVLDNQPEMIPSGFKGRTLLSTTAGDPIKVSRIHLFNQRCGGRSKLEASLIFFLL